MPVTSKTRMTSSPELREQDSIDVVNLYTIIEPGPGLQAIRRIFNKFPDPLRPDSAILELLEINLTKNDLEFNQEYF